MTIISRHDGAQVAMVLCVVIGCSNRSGRNKDVSFYRIICVIKKGPRDKKKKRSMKRRDGVHCCDLQGAHHNDHIEIPMDLFQTLCLYSFPVIFS